MESNGGHELVGKGLSDDFPGHHPVPSDGDAGAFQYGGPVPPGTECLAVAVRLLEQDDELDVLSGLRLSGYQKRVELDGSSGEKRSVHDKLLSTIGQCATDGRNDQDLSTKLRKRSAQFRDPDQVRACVSNHPDLAAIDRVWLVDDLSQCRRNNHISGGGAFRGGESQSRRDPAAEVRINVCQDGKLALFDLLLEDLAQFEC